MITALCEGAFQTILLKKATENYQSSEACSRRPVKVTELNDKAVKLIEQILY